MKKLIACIIAVIMVVSLASVLGACNNRTLPGFQIPEGGYDGSPVTIKFFSSMGQAYEDILNYYVDQFKELYPNITIEHTRGGDYDSVRDDIKIQLGNGQSPNVAFCYSDHVALYNRSKAVVTLDELIASQIEVTRQDGTTEILGLTEKQKGDFIQTYYNEGKSFGDDKMYMLPFAKSTELMYYNVTAFEEWGLEVPDHWFASDGKEGKETSDKTSMEYVLAVIKEKDPKSTPLGVDSGANWLITLFEQFETGYTKASGPDHYLFDNEDNYNILETLRRWYQNNWFTTRALLSGTYTSTYFTSLNSDEGKKSYISIGSSAGAAKQVPSKINGEYPFVVGVAMIPQKTAGMTNKAGAENFDYSNCKVISQGPSICIFNSANPQEVLASWLLVKFLTTNAEFEARYGMEAGYLPVIQSVKDLKAYSDKLANANTGENMSGMAAKLCSEFKDAFFVSPAFYGSAEARDQMDVLLNKCVVVSGATPDAIKAGIKQEFKNALAKCDQ